MDPTAYATSWLKVDAARIRLLAEYTEGNLLATHQAIIKLGLLYPHQAIGIKQIAEVIDDSAQFNIFELGQCLLRGDCRNTVRILNHLRSQDVEPSLVLWLIARECRSSQRSLPKLTRLLLQCHEIDKTIKGVQLGNAWQGLYNLSLDFISTA